jgi:hypothetical protein
MIGAFKVDNVLEIWINDQQKYMIIKLIAFMLDVYIWVGNSLYQCELFADSVFTCKLRVRPNIYYVYYCII